MDDAKTALAVADSGLESAKQQASLTRAGARAEDLHAAQLRVKTAKAALRQAENGGLQVQAKRREAQAAVESIHQRRADLVAAQTTAGYAVLRSPISGIVTKRAMNPGDVADPSTPVVEVANSGSLDLSASIPDEEGDEVRCGMPVRLHLPGDPHSFFAGRVLNVGQVDQQTGLLSVRITVSDAGQG